MITSIVFGAKGEFIALNGMQLSLNHLAMAKSARCMASLDVITLFSDGFDPGFVLGGKKFSISFMFCFPLIVSTCCVFEL